jgi:type IV secretory pathway TraG/TraD family ATPase VirD4
MTAPSYCIIFKERRMPTVASRGSNLYKLPTTVGDSQTNPLAYAVGWSIVLATSSVATQVVAYALGFNQSLGKPIWSTPFAFAKKLYAPYDWICWFWKFDNPFRALAPFKAFIHSTEAHHAFQIVPYILGWGMFAAIFGTLVAAVLLGKKDQVEDIVDSAKWADLADLEKEGLVKGKAGPIIGGFETKGGIVPIRYSGELGISYTGPPGDGKSALLKTNFLIPLQHEEAATWTENERRAHPYGHEPSIIVLDVKGNLVESTSRYQADVLGKDVFVLEPLGDTPEGRASYNPFWGIHLGTEREADDCYQASLDIVDMDGKGLPTYWDKACTAFGGAAIAKIGYRSLYLNDPRLFSLPGLVDYISSFPSVRELLDDMLYTPDDPNGVFGWADAKGAKCDVRPWVASVARAMQAKAEDEKSGVFGSFIEFLAIYRSEILRKHISSSTFSFKKLANSQRAGVVYINVPAMKLDALRPYLRMLTRSALRELTESTDTIAGREVRGNYRSTILALDEVASLKHVEEIGTASGFLRGHGVILMLFWQALAQLHRLYGDDESITETMDVHLFGRPKTFGAAESISEALGRFSTLVTKRNVSGKRASLGPRDHVSENADITTRNILTASEVMRFPTDRVIIFTKGLRINAKKFSYFLNPFLQMRAELGTVTRSSVMKHVPFFISNLEEKLGVESLKKLLNPVDSHKSAELPKDYSLPENAPPAKACCVEEIRKKS